MQEAVVAALQRAGCFHRVFRLTGETSVPLFDYLRSGGEADAMLVMGGDHHLWYLHDTEEKRAAWRKYRGHRVCNSFESTRDSLYKKYVARLKTALPVFSHFVHSDEVDATIFERAGVKSLWWPQAADSRMFSAQTRLSERDPRVFFCGKVWDEYPMRRALLDVLQQSRLCTTVTGISTGELVLSYNRHMLAINPPGVLGGFNVRTFEAIGYGQPAPAVSSRRPPGQQRAVRTRPPSALLRLHPPEATQGTCPERHRPSR